ncbi:MAG: phosphoglucosamine mutase [Gammaproteobacteria bacterium]|nr:MAG: phosphoglucosamine mutase [Gammaproteobacteria bacterium]RLA14712.1 MAG: phosphoglucosamine mutase [Gammaproteobacteria bacterium]
MKKRKYFGTDGIRGRVGNELINPEFVLKLGWALGKVLSREGRPKVVIGKDTRISGYMFESALEAGLVAAGVDIMMLGPMPTPAVAYLTRTFHAQAGIVISASHNPFYDNGIKFFSNVGEKFPDQAELDIEAQIEKPMHTVEADQLGKVTRVEDAAGRYIEFCKSTFSSEGDLRGLRVVVDCAHGATYHVAPAVFRELGAEVFTVGVNPDGLNINAEVGSTSPASLEAAVKLHRADIGIALDGDGDRLLMIDEKGEQVDGDELICVMAHELQRRGLLKGGVVGTVMSNLGLEQSLKVLGVPFIRANVGDRYVIELLKQKKWMLGGENSGHIITLDKTSTGDGIVAALQVVSAMLESGKTLYELKRQMVKLPQVLINVDTLPGYRVDDDKRVQTVSAELEQRLGDEGRILVRSSGTEPVVRVMVEGQDPGAIRQVGNELATAVAAGVAKFAAGE